MALAGCSRNPDIRDLRSRLSYFEVLKQVLSGPVASPTVSLSSCIKSVLPTMNGPLDYSFGEKPGLTCKYPASHQQLQRKRSWCLRVQASERVQEKSQLLLSFEMLSACPVPVEAKESAVWHRDSWLSEPPAFKRVAVSEQLFTTFLSFLALGCFLKT